MKKKNSMQKVILVKIDFIYNDTNIVENRLSKLSMLADKQSFLSFSNTFAPSVS